MGLKTHAKMSLVVRREPEGLVRYVHLGTGNYNPVTARIYTDLGYFTCAPEVAADVSDLFNALTGYSEKRVYRKLLVAPSGMREQILSRIEREIVCHREDGGGHLVFKLNSLVDKACIKALYGASQAGVRVDLQIRGICCLRPGLGGVSENIVVTSVVGRFLEHSRIFYFRNGGEDEIFLGSADLMPRNLEGRVEVLFPVEDPAILESLRGEILFIHLRDTLAASRLEAEGGYSKVSAEKGQDSFESQAHMLAYRRPWIVPGSDETSSRK
jgi:polyphosphate kinase